MHTSSVEIQRLRGDWFNSQAEALKLDLLSNLFYSKLF